MGSREFCRFCHTNIIFRVTQTIKRGIMEKTALILICSLLMVSGCMLNHHQKPDKFEVYPEVMKTFSSETSVSVITPKNNPEMLVENLNAFVGKGANMYYDMNELYKIAEEHITDTLKNNNVPVLPSTSKYIKFTVTKIQTEAWGGPFLVIMGVYMFVTVETSDGYKRDFKVQDQSATHLDRAVGGAISRAVEMVFQDKNVIKFIESKNT
jgi:hypothetical protein